MTPATFLASFARQDSALIKAGHPGLSPFWLRTVRSFINSRKRMLVVRAGRRSGKSLTAVKLAVAFALFGTWNVPPGELAAVAIVSVSLAEAQNKLRLVRAILITLGVQIARETSTEIELKGLPIVFKCIAANMRTAVGISTIFILVDEAARMRDETTGANQAREVVASLRPTQATHQDAVMVMVSAPLGKSDYHAECFERGDTPDQMVAHCETWVGNPTITEAQTHALEPDPRIWAREYAAQPQAGLLCVFEEDDIEFGFKARGDIIRRFRRLLAIDASSGKSDIFGWATAGYDETEGGQRVLSVDSIGGFTADEVKALGFDNVIKRIAAHGKAAGANVVLADQRESLGIGAAFRREGMIFRELPWTPTSKPRGVARLRRLFLERSIQLPEHAALKRELRTFEEKIDASGQITFAGHTGDHLACLITLCLGDEERKPPGSPVTRRSDTRDRGGASGRNEMAAQYAAADAVSDGAIDRMRVEPGSMSVTVGRSNGRTRLVMRGTGNGTGGF